MVEVERIGAADNEVGELHPGGLPLAIAGADRVDWAGASAVLLLNDGPLVVHDFPTLVGPAPDGRASSHAVVLQERVGEQVVVRRDLRAMEIPGFPVILNRVLIPFFKNPQHVIPAIASSGCSDFPERRFRHPFEVAARGSEFRPMKDGLSLHEFAECIQVLRVCDKIGLHGVVSENSTQIACDALAITGPSLSAGRLVCMMTLMPGRDNQQRRARLICPERHCEKEAAGAFGQAGFSESFVMTPEG